MSTPSPAGAPQPLPIEELIGQLVTRSSEIITAHDRLRSLLEANRSIVSELSLTGVLRRIVDAARDIARARYAALGVIGADGSLEQFVHAGMDAETVDRIGDLPTGRGVLGALIRDPHPIRLRAIADDPRSTGFPPGHPPMRSFLGVPVQSRGEIFGNLYLTDRIDGDDFTSEDQDLVLALASTAGVAVENARLYEESRRRQEWLRASAEISRDVLSPEPDGDVVVKIADSVRRLAAADVVTVVFPGPEPGQLLVKVARGQQADQLLGYTFPAEGSLAAAAMVDGRPRMLDPARDGDRTHVHLQVAFDIGPVMVCPLVGNAGIRGVITVGRQRGERGFSNTDLDMAETFATHAAVALELADRRADQQRLGLLEDRHRIARDLHDHVIQRLFATGLTIESTAGRVNDPDVAARLTGTVDAIDETIRQIRAAIFELRDRTSHLGATARAKLLTVVASAEPALGFVPQLSFDGPVDTVLDQDLEDDIAAVLREALSNTARHAHATRATATVSARDQQIVVEVTDNGADAPAVDRRSGLANLEERASARGGTTKFTHTPNGTTLRWTVPQRR